MSRFRRVLSPVFFASVTAAALLFGPSLGVASNRAKAPNARAAVVRALKEQQLQLGGRAVRVRDAKNIHVTTKALDGLVFKTTTKVPGTATIVQYSLTGAGGKSRKERVGYAAVAVDGKIIPLELVGKAETSGRSAGRRAGQATEERLRCVGDVCMMNTLNVTGTAAEKLFDGGATFVARFGGQTVTATPLRTPVHTHSGEPRLFKLRASGGSGGSSTVYRFNYEAGWDRVASRDIHSTMVHFLTHPNLEREKVMVVEHYDDGRWPERVWTGQTKLKFPLWDPTPEPVEYTR